MEYYKNYLAHHGIKGQKWGIRRYQNEDGSLTPAGKERYGVDTKGNIVNKDLYNKDLLKVATKEAKKSLFTKGNGSWGGDKVMYNKKDAKGNDVAIKTTKFKYDLIDKYGEEIGNKAADKAEKQVLFGIPAVALALAAVGTIGLTALQLSNN